jgi:hypothetical protein
VISQVFADLLSAWRRYKFFGPVRVPLTQHVRRLDNYWPTWLMVIQLGVWLGVVAVSAVPQWSPPGNWNWIIVLPFLVFVPVLPGYLRSRARRLLRDKLNASGGRLCTRCSAVIPGLAPRAACPQCAAPFEHVRDSWRWSVDLDLATMEQAEAAGVSLEADEAAGPGRSLAYRLGRAVRWVLTLGGRGGRAK